MKTGIITDLDVQRRVQDHLHADCELAENVLKSGRPAPTQQADQTQAGDLIQSSQSRSARALRAACSSASRAATLAACWERASSITSSIGVERSSCSSLAARETAAAATATLRAMYVAPRLSSARHSPSAVPVTV